MRRSADGSIVALWAAFAATTAVLTLIESFSVIPAALVAFVAADRILRRAADPADDPAVDPAQTRLRTAVEPGTELER